MQKDQKENLQEEKKADEEDADKTSEANVLISNPREAS